MPVVRGPAHGADGSASGSLPHAPVRQWVLLPPIPLRLFLTAQPKLLTPVLQVVHRVITRFLRTTTPAAASFIELGNTRTRWTLV